MPSGILIIDKPQDWTSMDVCAKIRGILREKRVGHGGTLDPMATGVLPVFVGAATRGAEFSENSRKEYIATLRLGLTTDTQDIWGTVLKEAAAEVSRTDVEQILPHFRGAISQIPPMYSAIKVQGQKLYQLARKGQEIVRTPRPVTIYELELLEQLSPAEFRLRCVCSKGTYIRTLCHDIGAQLGCGGCMSSLRRTMSAGFTLSQAITLEQVQQQGAQALIPIDRLFSSCSEYRLTDPVQETRVRNGNPISAPQLQDGQYRVYGLQGDFLCLSCAKAGVLTSLKNFFGA